MTADRPAPDPWPHVLGALGDTSLDRATADRLHDGMAGVTLFRQHNLRSRDQVCELTSEIHRAAGHLPALVAVDQEGGQLQALAGIVTDFPGLMAVAATRDLGLARRVGNAIGRELRALGVTVNFAPVCDVLTHAGNHALSIRAGGRAGADVADVVVATVRGLQEVGIAATAKHFPGKGDAAADTHYEQAVIERSRDEFDAVDLVPFRAAIEADVKLVMSSHAIVPGLTGGARLPATRSQAVMTALLRHDLGFQGVSITDALDMAAVGAGEIASADESAQALLAGADLLLTTPFMDIGALFTGLRRGLEDSPEASARLGASAARIDGLRRWLATFGIPDRSVVGCEEHQQLADEVAARSITVHRDGERVGGRAPDVVVQPQLIDLTKADTTSADGGDLAADLRAVGAGVHSIGVTHSPPPSEIASAVAAVRGLDAVVIATAAATEAAQVELVRAVSRSAASTTVVAARNPLDVEHLPLERVDRVVLTYGFTSSTRRALADVLTGAAAAPGTSPL